MNSSFPKAGHPANFTKLFEALEYVRVPSLMTMNPSKSCVVSKLVGSIALVCFRLFCYLSNLKINGSTGANGTSQRVYLHNDKVTIVCCNPYLFLNL